MLGDRSLFADLEARVYMNHAAISPPSARVRAACRDVVDSYARLGANAWLGWRDQRDELRAKLADLIGAAPTSIALVPNTSHGVVDVATAIRWRDGDRILTFDGEFPANVTPWQRAAARFGLSVEFLPVDGFFDDSGDGLAQLATELEHGARLVAVSAVRFQDGLRMPLAEIAALCRAHGAELFVDAIQAAGCTPLDVGALGVDYLVAGGHKWLMGLEGSGFLYVKEDRLTELDPLVAGWLSHEEGTSFLFEGAGHLRFDRPLRQHADVFEIGVVNSVGFAALDAAVSTLLEIGPSRIFDHVQTILDPLERGLEDRGFTSRRSPRAASRSCILSAVPPAGLELPALWQSLDDGGIGCATPDGHLRFSPHWPNDPGQVADVLGALDELLAAH